MVGPLGNLTRHFDPPLGGWGSRHHDMAKLMGFSGIPPRPYPSQGVG